MAQRIHTLGRALAARLGSARDERGSILLEALASAVLLAVVSLAVMSAVDGATASSARNKGRSVAAGLAEQDQERMRAMRFADLSTFNETNDRSVDGARYTVQSRADWVRDATGGTESCTNEDTQADYIRIRSTVTSDVVGKQTRPVTIESLVSPNVASFAPDEGTLAVRLIDRDDNPLPNINVSIGGPRALSDVTNSVGCAIFAHIPEGDYDINLSQTGWVTAKKVNRGSVVAGEVVVADVRYDKAAEVTAAFVTRAPGLAEQPALGWTLSGANAALPGTPVMEDASPSPSGSVTVGDLFPYKTGYSFYSGACESNDPSAAVTDYFATNPGFEALDPGEVVGAAPAPPLTIVQPGVRMRVVTKTAVATTGVNGARVVATSTGSGCTTSFVMTTVGGPVAPSGGWISKPATGAVTYDPSLPFGSYSICVQWNGTSRTVDVDNTDPAGKLAGEVDMTSAPSGSCP